jgi:hypothetical protein
MLQYHFLNDIFLVVLAMLLVPGNMPLVDLAQFAIPTFPSRDLQILTRNNLKQMQAQSPAILEKIEEGNGGSITEFSDVAGSEVSY